MWHGSRKVEAGQEDAGLVPTLSGPEGWAAVETGGAPGVQLGSPPLSQAGSSVWGGHGPRGVLQPPRQGGELDSLAPRPSDLSVPFSGGPCDGPRISSGLTCSFDDITGG